MACTDRFSFRAIDGLSRPDASNVKSCASSAGVHGRPVGRGPRFIWLSPSARPANVAGPGLSFTGAFNVKSQPLAFPDVVGINACRLQGADMKKNVRTAGVVSDETKAAIGIP